MCFSNLMDTTPFTQLNGPLGGLEGNGCEIWEYLSVSVCVCAGGPNSVWEKGRQSFFVYVCG